MALGFGNIEVTGDLDKYSSSGFVVMENKTTIERRKDNKGNHYRSLFQ